MLDLLAIGAHPDDVELFAGGTLAKMGALGYATGIVDMTRGELATRGTPAVRAREAKAAARILGVKVRENLGLPDGKVQADLRARLELVRILRKHRPSVVLVHYWEDRHPDHANTSRIVMEAAHNAGLEKIKTGQERFRPEALLYFMLPDHVLPSFIVDVSDFQEQRSAAIRAHRSQLFDRGSTEPATYLSRPDFLLHIENIHSYYGTLIGKPKGEAFLVRRTIAIDDPVEFFRKMASSPFF